MVKQNECDWYVSISHGLPEKNPNKNIFDKWMWWLFHQDKVYLKSSRIVLNKN